MESLVEAELRGDVRFIRAAEEILEGPPIQGHPCVRNKEMKRLIEKSKGQERNVGQERTRDTCDGVRMGFLEPFLLRSGEGKGVLEGFFDLGKREKAEFKEIGIEAASEKVLTVEGLVDLGSGEPTFLEEKVAQGE